MIIDSHQIDGERWAIMQDNEKHANKVNRVKQMTSWFKHIRKTDECRRQMAAKWLGRQEVEL